MQYICKKCRWQKTCEDHEGLTRDIQDCGDFKPRTKKVGYIDPKNGKFVEMAKRLPDGKKIGATKWFEVLDA